VALAGCGVKITNIAVPESAMVEKGESITLPVVYGTDDAPAVTPETAATGESAETDEKLAKAASKLTVEWTSSDESVATVDATGMVVAVSAGEADITASVTDSEMSAVCKVTVKVAAKDITVPDNLDVKLNDGNETTVEATVSPADATDVKVSYASTDEAVATVDKDGRVQVLQPGECDITTTLMQLRVRLCRCRVRLCGSWGNRCRVGRRHSRTVAGTAAFISLVAGRDLLRLFNRHFVVGTFLTDSCGDGCLTGRNCSDFTVLIDCSDLLVAVLRKKLMLEGAKLESTVATFSLLDDHSMVVSAATSSGATVALMV